MKAIGDPAAMIEAGLRQEEPMRSEERAVLDNTKSR
jgi:hypothetical protein